MKEKLKYLWMSTTLSFLLSLQYIERYTEERNRMLFHWSRSDGLAIVFSTFLIGLLFFLLYLAASRFKNHYIKKGIGFSFILLLGIAIIKDIEWWLSKLGNLTLWPETSYKLIVYLLYGLLFWALCVHLFTKTARIKNAFKTLCLILSPIIPVFLITSFSYKTWTVTKGSLPKTPQLVAENPDKSNTFIFFFDEWSYSRSYKERTLLPIFKHLGEFKELSAAFHNAYSPHRTTYQSLPRFIFQNNFTFSLKNNRFFFQTDDAEKITVEKMDSIFTVPHSEGYFNAIVAVSLPYAHIVGNDVDFISSHSVYKMQGSNFLDRTFYHLLKSFVLYSFRFFPQTAKWAEEAYLNREQVRRTAMIHEQALAVIKNVTRPTFALFHYTIPHEPFVFDSEGPKDVFRIYEWIPDNYMENLSYLDKIIGEIILTLQQSGKYENSLIVMTSDHSWRDDPDVLKDESNPKQRHIPLFVKFPGQKRGYQSDDKLNTSALFNYIKRQR